MIVSILFLYNKNRIYGLFPQFDYDFTKNWKYLVYQGLFVFIGWLMGVGNVTFHTEFNDVGNLFCETSVGPSIGLTSKPL